MIVQNNTGSVAGANSYTGFVYACNYLADRVNLSQYTEDQIANVLVQATSFIDNNFTYAGSKLAGETQTTQFPRTVEGIPDAVKRATCEYAIFFLEQGLSMIGSPPEEYFGDRYVQADNVIKSYVQAYEAEVADGKKYCSESEKFIYEAGLFQLVA